MARNNPDKAPPGFADKLDHFLLPKGPAGRYHTVTPFHNCITKYSPNKEAAKEYIRYTHMKENFEKSSSSTKAMSTAHCRSIRKMWEKDPAITIYRELPKYGRTAGYAGPYNRNASGSAGPNTSSSTCSPKPSAANRRRAWVAWAGAELKNVYARG